MYGVLKMHIKLSEHGSLVSKEFSDLAIKAYSR